MTTVKINEDVWSRAKRIAIDERKPLQEVVDALLRKALGMKPCPYARFGRVGEFNTVKVAKA